MEFPNNGLFLLRALWLGYIDSGASCHMIGVHEHLTDLT
jgi:hypothetical protein